MGSVRRMEDLPGQVDGALLRDAAALRRLRAAWGDALIVVHGGNLEKADLRGARLHNICFLQTKLAGSDWRGARPNGIGFRSSDLTGADLGQASMPGVLFDGPFLDRVDASGADFSGGRMTGNDFGGWDGLKLDRASLRDFRFDCRPVSGEQCVADWGKVSFRGADLGGASVDGYWGDADWTGARLAGTRVNLRQLPKLHGARIAGDLLVHEQPATSASPPLITARSHRGSRSDATMPRPAPGRAGVPAGCGPAPTCFS